MRKKLLFPNEPMKLAAQLLLNFPAPRNFCALEENLLICWWSILLLVPTRICVATRGQRFKVFRFK
jgi:hypothetical protein